MLDSVRSQKKTPSKQIILQTFFLNVLTVFILSSGMQKDNVQSKVIVMLLVWFIIQPTAVKQSCLCPEFFFSAF